MYRGLLVNHVNHEKVVKFLNFICSGKIKSRRKFSGICQVNPIKMSHFLCSFFFLTKDPKQKLNLSCWPKIITILAESIIKICNNTTFIF